MIDVKFVSTSKTECKIVEESVYDRIEDRKISLMFPIMEFSNGVLSANTYSYDGHGSDDAELDVNETYKLYETMKNYFEDKVDNKINQFNELLNLIKGEIELTENPSEQSDKIILQSIKCLIEQFENKNNQVLEE